MSKNPSLPWNCCGACAASPLPPPHPTTHSLITADTRVEFFNGAERPWEVRGSQVLVQLNQAKSVLCRFVHESQLHVGTQLFVGQLQKILGNKDCGLCKDTPLPTAVETTQLLKIFPHATNADILLSSPVYLALSLRDVQVLRGVLFSTSNAYTVRGAEHVLAHTVETRVAQFEHHNRKGSQDDLFSKRSRRQGCRAHTRNDSTP